MQHGVVRWGSLDCLGNEFSALPKPPLHRWSGTPGKPLERPHFPQSPNIGGAHAGMAVLLGIVLFIQEYAHMGWSSSVERLALMT